MEEGNLTILTIRRNVQATQQLHLAWVGSLSTMRVFLGVIFHIKSQEHRQVQTSKALNAIHSVQWDLQRMEASKKTSAAAADCSK